MKKNEEENNPFLYHDLNIKRLYAFIANKYLLLYPLLINVKKTFTKDIRKCAPYLLTCCETFCCGGQIANNFSNLSSASFTFHSIASLISSRGFGNTDTNEKHLHNHNIFFSSNLSSALLISMLVADSSFMEIQIPLNTLAYTKCNNFSSLS